ncbi:unnamed protein product [Cyprideis torosa]|uniref:Uncharacterized protein n=1 Tax=Cyprideis torosa TaxID=163714 RepID=A0A7R8ZK57_9CRUS|nr:unnamed protein product [Cyprideis torosa]CAG0883763.1 unnamed protein product [Cyprideis torosa]
MRRHTSLSRGRRFRPQYELVWTNSYLYRRLERALLSAVSEMVNLSVALSHKVFRAVSPLDDLGRVGPPEPLLETLPPAWIRCVRVKKVSSLSALEEKLERGNLSIFLSLYIPRGQAAYIFFLRSPSIRFPISLTLFRIRRPSKSQQWLLLLPLGNVEENIELEKSGIPDYKGQFLLRYASDSSEEHRIGEETD